MAVTIVDPYTNFTKPTTNVLTENFRVNPSVTEYFQEISLLHLIFIYLCGFLTLATIVLFCIHLYVVTKWVTSEQRQSALIKMIMLFPVTTTFGFIGICVPRTLSVMKMAVTLYFANTLFVFTGYVRSLFGGRRAMAETLLAADAVISYQNRPCCCCCQCLPNNVQPTTMNLAITEWLVLQSPVLRSTFLFIAMIEILETGGVQTQWMASSAGYITIVSSLLAVYGCTVLTTLADNHVYEYGIARVFKLLNLNIIIFQLQGAIFDTLANTNVIQDDKLLPRTTKANIYCNMLLSLEMLLMCVYVTLSLRPSDNAAFDRHPNRPLSQKSLHISSPSPSHYQSI